MAIRVVAVEDHPLMLKAIREELTKDPEIQMVGEATQGSKLTQLVRECNPNVVVLDLGMSGEPFEPISAVKNLLENFPTVRVLILSGHDNPLLIRSMIDAGACGYILKSDNLSLNLPKAVKYVRSGGQYFSDEVVSRLFAPNQQDVLTNQELAVLRQVAQGLSNTSIAASMNISEKRVRNILTFVYTKLDILENPDVNPRVTSVLKAREMGLLSGE